MSSNPPTKRMRISSLERTVTRSITRYTRVSEYSVRSRSSAEMSSMISLALFSRPISCLASSSACFFICLSWSISLLICLIRRSPISLSSIVSSRSKSLFRSWSLFSITRELIAVFSPPIQCISASCRVSAFFSGGLELAY